MAQMTGYITAFGGGLIIVKPPAGANEGMAHPAPRQASCSSCSGARPNEKERS